MKIAGLFFKILLFLLFLVSIAVLWLFSSGGQEYINNLINRQLAATGYNIQLNRISISLPLILKVREVNLSDRDGQWLTIKDAKISLLLSPELIKKRITINEISSSQIIFLRKPVSLKQQGLQANSVQSSIVNIDYSVMVERLAIDNIIIHNDDKIYELSFTGKFSLLDNIAEFESSINLINNQLSAANLLIQGNYNIPLDVLELSEIRVDSKFADLTGNLKINLNDYTGSGNIIVTNDDLSNLSEGLTGNLQTTLNISTTDSKIDMQANFTGDVSYNEQQLINDAADNNLKLEYDYHTQDGSLSLHFVNILNATMGLKKIENLFHFKEIKIVDKYKNEITGRMQLDLTTKFLIGEIKLRANNLAKFNSQIKGIYNCQLKLDNKDNKQIFDFTLKGQNLPISQFPSLNLQVAGFLQANGGKNFTLNLNRLQLAGNKVILKNTKSVTIISDEDNIVFDFGKILLDNGHLNFSGNKQGDNISANLVVNVSPDNLLSLILPPRHKIKTKIDGKLQISGEIANPKINGNIKIRDSNYKDLKLGIEIKNILADINIKDNRLLISNCKFHDIRGRQGGCKADINLTDVNKNFSFEAHVSNFYLLVPSMGAQGEINVDLKLVGNNTNTQLTGNVNINRLDIIIPEHFGPNVPELNIVDLNKINEKTSSERQSFTLDVDIMARHKVFVRGWGLDIELRGDLKLHNPQGEFLIDGTLSTIRGRYQEFGKYFAIKKGNLVFEGEIPPSPYLDIMGTTTQDNTQVNLLLTGPLFKPALSINSNPALSQEEALSLILFGKRSNNISAFQAISLANSLRKLSGHGNNDLEVIGKVRKILNVDEISINTKDNSSGGATIGVGKYLSEKLYLRIEKGIEAGKTSVEYEFKPNISIEGEAQEEGYGSIGINWKKDY